MMSGVRESVKRHSYNERNFQSILINCVTLLYGDLPEIFNKVF